MKNLHEILTAQIRSINDRYVATVHDNYTNDISRIRFVWDECMAKVEAIYEIAVATGCVWQMRDDNCQLAKNRIIKNFDRAFARKRKSAA